MGRARVSGAQSGYPGRKRARKRRRSPGIAIVARDGFWHLQGTLRAKGRSKRVRQTTGLPAEQGFWHDADEIRAQLERDFRGEVIHGKRPSDPLAVAACDYLEERIATGEPLGAGDVKRIQEVGKKFGDRVLDTITQDEWNKFVLKRHAGNKPESRERWLNPIVAFLTWCVENGRMSKAPVFRRNQEARKPKHRRARRVAEITPELVLFLAQHAAPHLRGQIAIMWSTGARVSSVLFGCRVADLVMAPGREQITFHDTKNGEDVTAALHEPAAILMAEYLEWRGHLEDREAPLFLTRWRKPYSAKGRETGRGGGGMKHAFNGMKRRAIAALRQEAAADVRRYWRVGNRAAARARLAEAHDRCALVAQITPHWFRHLLATTMLSMSGDLRAVMEQGGWLTAESVLSYAHDVPERRRDLVRRMGASVVSGTGSKEKA